jgi:hypothetical protein
MNEVLTPEQVAKIRSIAEHKSTNSGRFRGTAGSVLRLCDSHETLRGRRPSLNPRTVWAAAALDIALSEGRTGGGLIGDEARVALVVLDSLVATGLLPKEYSRDALLGVDEIRAGARDEPRWLTRSDYEKLPHLTDE